MIQEKKVVYGTLTKSAKTLAAKQIVVEWRSGGGRFLKLNDETGLWDDVGDAEAKVKAAQALREKRNSKVKTQSSASDNLLLPTQNSLAANMPDIPPPMPPLLVDSSVMAVAAAVEATPSSSLVATGSIIQGSNLMIQAPSLAFNTQPLSSMHTDYLGILSDCLRAVGVSGVSSLSLKGSLEEEFVTIKKSYFEAMLRASQQPGNSYTAVRFSRTAFVLLKGMFHKLKAQQSTFVSFFAAAKGGGGSNLQFIEDLYTIAWQSTQYCPPEQHLLMAASAQTPSVCVEISVGSSRQCVKCSRSCTGKLTVGMFGKWQHLTCWNQVPVEIWLGLTQQQTNAMVGRNDVMANLDEIFLKGFSNLDFASQVEFVRYAMQRENWVMAGLGTGMNTGLVATQPSLAGPLTHDLSSTSSGENFFAFPPLGADLDKKRASDTTDKAGDVNSRELARPLKKRAVGSVDVLPQPQHQGGALNSNSVLNSQQPCVFKKSGAA